jgi:hypothetical protein
MPLKQGYGAKKDSAKVMKKMTPKAPKVPKAPKAAPKKKMGMK